MPRNGIFSFFYCWSSTTTLQICSLFSSLSLKKFQFEIFEISDFPLVLWCWAVFFFVSCRRISIASRILLHVCVRRAREFSPGIFRDRDENLIFLSSLLLWLYSWQFWKVKTQRWHSFSRNHQTRSQWVFTSIHETLKASKITLSKHSSVDNAHTNNWIHLMSSCCASQLENSQNKISFTHYVVCCVSPKHPPK